MYFREESEEINVTVSLQIRTLCAERVHVKQQPLYSEKKTATGAGTLQSFLMNILVTGYSVNL